MKVFIVSCLLAAVLGLKFDKGKQAFIGVDKKFDLVLQTDEVLKPFEEDDANNDGKLSLEEFTAHLPPGMSEQKIEGAFSYYDKLDGSKDDAVALTVFKMLDANDDCQVTFKEHKRTLPKIGLQERFNRLLCELI